MSHDYTYYVVRINASDTQGTEPVLVAGVVADLTDCDRLRTRLWEVRVVAIVADVGHNF
jgi:hypothetical protein